MNALLAAEIAATAARLVVEEGLEYGPAKRRALCLPPVSETGTNGASLAPDQQTVRPKTRPTP